MSEYIVRETGFPGTLKTETVGELVRCRDCRYFHYGTPCIRFGIRMSRAHDDYCSYGGRKNAEQVSRADDRNA